MNLNSLTHLSNEELDRNLRELRQTPEDPAEADRLQQTIQELQVHQIELEMHNRALREAQTELEHAVRRYTDLYDHLPIGYLTVDLAGVITAANRAAHECLNPDRRGLYGRYLGNFFDSYDAGRLTSHFESCFRTGNPGTIELTLRPAGGDPVVVQISSRPALSGSEQEAKIHVAIVDITKLRQDQRTLLEINREQEAFNYSISHDLRAPLVTINNYAGVVLSDFGDGLGKDGRAMVERMRCAAARMEATLKHLLEYSTLAREEIVFEKIDTEVAVKELLIEHRGYLEEKQAQISVEHPLPAVRGCRPILNQVMANLLTNAVKYTRDGERADVRIFAETQANMVVLKIADRGIGIEPKYHERIFRLFERLHGYSQYPGSGIGLAIARRAVERMNGEIWVESGLGEGSCFCLKLPKG